MDVLLLTPPFTTEDRYGRKLKLVGPMSLPSAGLGYIGAVLEGGGHKVTVIDTPILNMTASEVGAYVKKHSYDLIGLTGHTPMYRKMVDVVREIKSAAPDTPLVVGGPHATILPIEVTKENPGVDFVVFGEGEYTMSELCSYIERGSDSLKNIRGIVYRDNGKIVKNEPRPLIKNLDELPFPAWHLFPVDKYVPAPSSYRRLPVLHMITTRGCPYKCIYCSSRSIFGRVNRRHSPKRIADEMEWLISNYGAKEIFFLDDIFTLNRKWTEEVCREIMRRGINEKVEWSCSTRVNVVDKPMLEMMKKAGCWQIHYGLESGSQRLLDYIKKGITLGQSRRAVRWAAEVGIQTRAYFMLGLPTETVKESGKTIEFAKEVNADYAKFSLTTPYPGTELFDIAKKEGDVKSFSWERYKTLGGFTEDERPYVPRGRSSEELKEIQKRAYKEYYLRPSYILSRLGKIRSLSELKGHIKGFLALLQA